MDGDPTPWRSVPLVGDHGRPVRASWRGLGWAGYEHDPAVAGSRLHYLDYTAGHRRGGDVFILAHGLGGRWQHWSENIPALGQRGRVIAVDLPRLWSFPAAAWPVLDRGVRGRDRGAVPGAPPAPGGVPGPLAGRAAGGAVRHPAGHSSPRPAWAHPPHVRPRVNTWNRGQQAGRGYLPRRNHA